ncbi:helix-turn-helix domain-containing protein [Streptomyces javensis]|uniref:Helix-turn-helix domain-containing protein n=1 Tax=Streptomyces javensis TaxID=114698 RepID=A0ABS0RA97_9ACTN|nr:helix-turn-helix domain-containing protein [Streptomyces javensis]MBI0314327.1 helix-turn-helix domain-containing protein [Streptomyces javensis]
MLTETIFRSEKLPRADRFDHWCELISTTHIPLELRSDHAAEYLAYQRVITLGAVQVWPTVYQPLHFYRTPKLIRRSDPEQFHIALPLRGVNHVECAGQTASFAPYELHFFDSSQPFHLYSTNDNGLFSGVGINIPKALLPKQADQLLGRPMPGREGIGALFTQFLARLVADSGSLTPADGPRLGTVLADLACALFAQALDAEHALPSETRQRNLALRIKAFIRQNLPDPKLTPSTIAAAHHISVRYLHRIFRNEDRTVVAWIRHQRLEHAARDLTDPTQHATPIHAIAARWGFARHADFTRAFRGAYGVPPRDYRSERRCAIDLPDAGPHPGAGGDLRDPVADASGHDR